MPEAPPGLMDQRDSETGRQDYLSTLPAGRAERRLAAAVVLVSAAFFLAFLPFAKAPMGESLAFIPSYESALVVNDLITALLLLGQFGYLGAPSLLVLACGYLFAALMTVLHGLSFPGLFGAAGLLGAGPQSTAWLYMFWHGGFPLAVAAYAMMAPPETGAALPARPARAICAGVAAALGAAAAAGSLATFGHELLPALMHGDHYSPGMVVTVSFVWSLSVLALVLLWRRRPHSVLDLWLMVVVCAWQADIALSAVFNGGRFDLGFYAGRIYGLLASAFVLTVLLVDNGRLYAQLLRAHQSERRERLLVQQTSSELKAVNQELDAFSYTVSHDLRAPLRTVDGFARMLEEDYSDRLDAEGRRLLGVVRDGSRKMSRLIDELLEFSRLGRAPILLREVRMEELARQAIADLGGDCAGREIDFVIGELGTARADPALLAHALANLIGNAVKYTRRAPHARIEIGRQPDGRPDTGPSAGPGTGPGVRPGTGQSARPGEPDTYYVRDNGAGFDMQYSSKLFGVFQRLHSSDEFEGTGVGLAIVHRVISRHGGRIWFDAQPGEGAVFYFTLAAGADAAPVTEPQAWQEHGANA